MKQQKIPGSTARDYWWALSILVLFLVQSFSAIPGFGQSTAGWQLDKMPPDLEMEWALSALPPHLRDSATVWLLDPKKGYYLARQGTNGFTTYVHRTEWERVEFVKDTYAAIAYDAEGAKIYLPPTFAVAEMRASGKYTPQQIRDTIVKRVKNGMYKAPSRCGVSYMLGPVMRTRLDEEGIVSMIMPHYMFFAPRVDNIEIGGVWDGHGPYAISSGPVLDKEHSIFNFIIIPAGSTEKAAILEADKDLLRKLGEYNPVLRMEPGMAGHQH
jgi:hypothetical protein